MTLRPKKTIESKKLTFLGSIPRSTTCLTNTVSMISFLVSIFLTNFIMIIFYNGRITSKIQLSSSKITCLLISIIYSAIKRRQNVQSRNPLRHIHTRCQILISWHQKNCANKTWLNITKFLEQIHKYLMGLLVFILTKKSTLISYRAQNWYTIERTWFLASMKKHSKRNSNVFFEIGILKESGAFKWAST